MSDEGQVLRVRAAGGASTLLAPSVGTFLPAVAEGALVAEGQSIGAIDILGVRRALIVPAGVSGRVTQRIGGERTRVPVQYGDVLITVATISASGVTTSASAQAKEPASSLSFAAPMSGRFYSRPSPNDPAFVSVGETVSHGQTVGLLEVMKTFNRLVYQGEGLPSTAKVARIVPGDGDDVLRGDPILLLDPDEG
jgi:acetyl-CoA carboxylase biotin carboxyl carrier protein